MEDAEEAEGSSGEMGCEEVVLRFWEREAERDSTASRQGKVRGGFWEVRLSSRIRVGCGAWTRRGR